MVAPAGLEPARPKAHDFKSRASTSFAKGPRPKERMKERERRAAAL